MRLIRLAEARLVKIKNSLLISAKGEGIGAKKNQRGVAFLLLLLQLPNLGQGDVPERFACPKKILT